MARSSASATNSLEDIHAVVSDVSQTSADALGLRQRIDLAHACLVGVAEVSREWVEAACAAKGIPAGSPARTEEILAGPVAALRVLRLLIDSLSDLQKRSAPVLPGRPTRDRSGWLVAPIFPTRSLYDSLLFFGFTSEAWFPPDVPQDQIQQTRDEILKQPESGTLPVTALLGAGNVSSIPATDVLSIVLQDGEACVLKMNPVNDYLTPLFERAFRSLIDADLLRIIKGDGEVGAALVHDDRVSRVHITGSHHTHDRIVWGPPDEQERNKAANTPQLDKPITSELGNVSPWIIVPGHYSDAQLRSQAEQVATSIVNNVSFNCLATKMLITSRAWPQRERFLAYVEEILQSTPLRRAYYPGAAERYERFTGTRPENPELLPWALVTDTTPESHPLLFAEESFAPVCGETALDTASPADFLREAVAFANEQLWGTLCASVTIPKGFRKAEATTWSDAVAALDYGTIAFNQWSALSYALGSPPWGGVPGTTTADVGSGIGTVHNTYFLKDVTKSVLEGPLVVRPKGVWLTTHKNPEPIAWRFLDLYAQPSLARLTKLTLAVAGLLR